MRCGRLELYGIDEGIPYRVAPLPLTVLAELKARVAGRGSFAVHGDFVTHRDAMRMRGDSHGRPAVVATHECFAVITPEDIDESGVLEVARIVKQASKVTEDPSPMSDKEESALILVSRDLHGLIIDQTPAPF